MYSIHTATASQHKSVYVVLCRLIRLGYNVLLLDSDTAMLDDPYKYFKQPPFDDIVVLNQEEDGIISTNGGILYVQNSAPDGPAAFMFAETVSRPYRWADDNWETAASLSIHPKCLYSDQDAYNDVLADMVSGYMVFPKAWWCLCEVDTSIQLAVMASAIIKLSCLCDKLKVGRLLHTVSNACPAVFVCAFFRCTFTW